MNRTENEGLAEYLVGQLDQNAAKGGQIYYLLARRADGIDGPYLQQFANWCVRVLEHGNMPQASFASFDRSLTDPPLAYLDLHPEDVKLRERIVAVAAQSANISRYFRRSGLWFEPRTPGGPLFLNFGLSLRVLFDQKALHDGMSVEEATAILGRPATQGPTEITWIYMQTARSENHSFRPM